MSRVYHPTDLELYQMCPQKYFLSKDERVEAAFTPWARLKGTIIHDAIANPGSPFDRIFDHWIRDCWPPINRDITQMQADYDDMLAQVNGALSYIKNNNIEVVETEKTIQYKIRMNSFEGTADAIVRMPDTPEGMVDVWDYKTGKKWHDTQINRKLQFGHYYMALWQKDIRVHRLFWAQTQDVLPYKRGGKFGKKGDPKGPFLYPVHITKRDLDTILGWTHQILYAIQQNIRYPNPFAPCNSCEYQGVCPKYEIGTKPVEPEPEAVFAQQDKEWAEAEKELSNDE